MYKVTIELPENYEILMADALARILAKKLTPLESEYLIKKIEESEDK